MLPKITVSDSVKGGRPATSFHFLVSFLGIGSTSIPNLVDIRFQKVSGVGVSMNSLDTKKSDNKKISLPEFSTTTNLILERGYLIGTSILRKELELDFFNFEINKRNILILLLDARSAPVASWLFYNAYPVRWAISDLDATQSGVLLETIEISYDHFKTLSL